MNRSIILKKIAKAHDNKNHASCIQPLKINYYRMKSIKYIISTILLLLVASYASAQTIIMRCWESSMKDDSGKPYSICWNVNATATVNTPAGNSVLVLQWYSDDWTSTQKNDLKNAYMKAYSGVTFEEEATTKYNCHAWAWAGGTTFWMQRSSVSKYWQDYSYEITSSSLATIVFYQQKNQVWTEDHSAVTTTTPDYYISKWGAGPRFYHHKNNCPYKNHDFFYYHSGILGSNNIYFSGEEYTLNYTPPSGSTINWSASAGSPFTVSSNTGTSTKLLKKTNLSSGTGTLTAAVNGNIYTKNIVVNPVGISGPSSLNWGTGSTYFIMEAPYFTSLLTVPGTSYSWWGDEGILSVSGNGSSGATVNAPNGWGTEMDAVNCAVTLNGVTDYFYKKVTIK